MKGLFWTLGGLIVLEVIVTSTPASQIGGAFGAVTTWLQEWLDPAVPLIKGSATKATSTSSAPPASQTIPPAGRLPAPSVPVQLA